LALSLNVYIGTILLLRKTKQSFKRFLLGLDQLAMENNLQVYFIGVVPTPCVFFDKLTIGRLNRYLKSLPYKKLIYVDVFKELAKDEESNYTINQFHLSEKGHQIISNNILNHIINVIRP